MRLAPLMLSEARRFIAEHHRHSGPPCGWRFGVSLREGEEIVGVGIAEIPRARMLNDGETIEITRVCTLGQHNGCSRLYGALCKAAKALGYRRVVTYTLASEPGSRVRAAGFDRVADLDPRRPSDWQFAVSHRQCGFWDEQDHEPQKRVRWERRLVRPDAARGRRDVMGSPRSPCTATP